MVVSPRLVPRMVAVVSDVYEKLSWEYIDPLELTTQDFEDFAGTLNLKVEGQANNYFIETRVKLPLFNASFYSFINYHKYVPKPEDFADTYFSDNEEAITKFSEDHQKAIRGRLFRTYTSLFRDIHFYHFLRESGHFEKVLFVLKYDVESKVDAFVKYLDNWYGLQLFIETSRSRAFYNKKPSRTKDKAVPKNATLIALPIKLDGAHTVTTQGDDLYLYHTRELESLMTRLKEERVVEVA